MEECQHETTITLDPWKEAGSIFYVKSCVDCGLTKLYFCGREIYTTYTYPPIMVGDTIRAIKLITDYVDSLKK